ncbi:MAG TPA: hypothetical protein EYN28_01760 [Flavobacteriales bacterium]|nr:hypothetical protein [Flavobacteriales bacterium]HIB77259.1 hypothetical protein [Flavobacteriales bacterium]HIO15600.1 hypothetical protein [Flavobacteriales bacterium]HIO58884.1 hypothetical protein [Flavobacteriales bacterium]
MLSPELFEKALAASIQAAGAGAKVLLSALPSSDSELHIASKNDGSLVSDADYASEKIITEILTPLGIPMITEEGSIPPYEERKCWKNYFLIDPLDGTESFLSHRSGFAVNIALCDETGPIIGIVADPIANRIYIGAMGHDFSITQIDGLNPKTIIPEAIQKPYRLVTSWVEEASLEDLVPPGIDPSEVIARPVSGALKFCKLALGEAEIHVRTGSYMEWDCAAGDAILRSVGVDVLDIKTNKRLAYNSEDLRVNGLYASRL